MRPRVCEESLRRGGRIRQLWDLLVHCHERHLCNRIRSAEHEHIGRHVCECGVKWR